MTELRNVEQEIGRFHVRVIAAALFVLFAFGLLTARLVYLQVYKHDELATQAESNRISVVPIVPNRGLIVDRNGIVLANNYSGYTLEITPANVPDLEGTIDRLSRLVEISPRDRKRFKRLTEQNSSFESLPIRTRLSDEEVARFAVRKYRFAGVELKARLFRNYPLGEVGSHLIGYIGRINEAEKAAIDDSDAAANYRGTQYIGKLGIEQSYEAELHGTTGFEELETSASGHPVRLLKSNPPTRGSTLVLSIDIRLQALVEKLYGDRRGALVAIDPRSGEVLAFVSKPNFDPNLFVDGIDYESWTALNESPDKPLLNRASRGTYPPGSTYKPFMALAALTLGKRTPADSINDPGYFWLGNHKFRDDKPGGHGVVDMYKSIVQSCDTYYYVLAHDLGVDAIHDFMAPIGFGQLTGIDMRGELRGTLPSTAWKHESFRTREQRRWYAGETISLGIGQGYNSFTMLQLAQATATLAEGGRRFRPHLVKSIESADAGGARRLVGEALPPLPWRAEDVAVIRRAMYGVTQEGTSRAVFAGAPYASGGKTGTAQVIRIGKNEKYDASELAEHHRDHALYTAFAPLDAPRIALALVVENAGFGAAAAAPIARRVLDYVMLGLYPSEADIAATQAGKSTVPIGTPRPAASVPLPGVTIDLSSMAGIEPAPPRVPVGAADSVESGAPVAAPAPSAVTPVAPTVAVRKRAPRAPATTPRQRVALRSDPSADTR